MSSPYPRNKSGFTLVELLVVIITLVILIALLQPFGRSEREYSRRVSCLKNLNTIWKSLVDYQDYGNDSFDRMPSNFPITNLTGTKGVMKPTWGMTPDQFVCPSSSADYGTKPANNFSEILASNSSYCYFAGRTDKDGDMVILCDQNGPMGVPTTNSWGLNHRVKYHVMGHMIRRRAQGGNIVKVCGSGMWVSTTNDPAQSAVCITNANIAVAFETNTNTVVYFY